MSDHSSNQSNENPGQESMLPTWMYWVFAILFVWGGAYLMRYSGGFSGEIYDESSVTYGPVQGGAAAAEDPKVSGGRVFKANCAQCHQVSGLGVEGQYPPLVGSEFVLGSEAHVIRLVLHGLGGPVTVAGKSFNGNMPPWKDVLDDKKIAQVLTYIRSDWGNNAPAITPEMVAAVRKQETARTAAWTEKEIQAAPKDLPK
ncbi:MAG: c-type cytochrome [Verrucomicrobiota bacterium]